MTTAVRLSDAPIGTPHHLAVCLWCQRPLVVAEVGKPALRCWVCPVDYPRQIAYAIVAQTKGGRRFFHVPLPTQVAIYELGKDGGAILWGGMKGGAKSVGVRWWLYHRSLSIPGHEALLLRENWGQLQDNHTSKMAHEVPELGGRWYEGDQRAVFGKGSEEAVITCGHMADADAVLRYAGGNKGAIGCDEGSLYPVDREGVSVLAELRTMARVTHVNRAGETVKPVFVVSTNPGGPSAAYLKDLFIDKAPDYEKFPRLKPVYDEGGRLLHGYDPSRYHFLPATLETNPYINADEYRAENLSGLSEIRYKQLALGDWSAFVGMFFPEWDAAQHVCEATICAA